MCLIIIKKAGVELPSEKILKDSWDNNPDGGGYMLPSVSGGVQIKKGFMCFSDFMKSINTVKNIKDIPVIIHFRITTHGGTSKANTHPFPVTSDIKKLRATRTNSNLALAHNGTINISNDKKLSDTMQYIKDELSLFNVIKPYWYKDIKSLDFIKNRIGSKLAIMDSKGYIATVGEFYEDEGILYSNYSYIAYNNYIYGYDYGYDYYMLDGDSNLVDKLRALGMFAYEARELIALCGEELVQSVLDNEPNPIDILFSELYPYS